MEHLIVDGYNAIHAWPSLKRVLANEGLEPSRRSLVARLAEYAAVRHTRVTVVFDAHGRAPGREAPEQIGDVTIVFGNEHASADHVIERLCSEASHAGRAGEIVVATSDRLERMMVSAMGVATMAVTTLEAEVVRAERDVHDHGLLLADDARA